MAAVPHGWNKLAGFACLALCVAQAVAQDRPYRPEGAQERPYRCESRGSVTYSQIPCPGGRQLGARPPRTTDKWKAPPQDRAVIARRAGLSPQDRQACRALDRSMAGERRMLKARGAAVTLQDELQLVQMKKQFRELKC